MAYKNKVIRNPKTGQEIKFLQTARDTRGELLEMQTTFMPFSKEPPAHYHPSQKEYFEIQAGELHLKINGELRILKAGEQFHIPVNTIHAMWNNSDLKTVVNWKVQPAMDTEHFLETSTGIAANAKTNQLGMPNLLQVAILAKRFSNVFRLSKPPYALQLVLFSLLIPIAKLAGYKAVYKEYID